MGRVEARSSEANRGRMKEPIEWLGIVRASGVVKLIAGHHWFCIRLRQCRGKYE
jgi:hypothetical protein